MVVGKTSEEAVGVLQGPRKAGGILRKPEETRRGGGETKGSPRRRRRGGRKSVGREKRSRRGPAAQEGWEEKEKKRKLRLEFGEKPRALIPC